MDLLKIIGAFAILRAASPSIFKWTILWPLYTLAYGATLSLLIMITTASFSLAVVPLSFLAAAIIAAVIT